jgi:hypothetical protein
MPIADTGTRTAAIWHSFSCTGVAQSVTLPRRRQDRHRLTYCGLADVDREWPDDSSEWSSAG